MPLPELSGPFAAIALAALATYSLRAGGLLLAERMPRNIRFRRAMHALPGALMFSIVVPSALEEGVWGVAAALSAALIARRTGNVFAAMVAAMAIIFLKRHAGL